MWTKSGKANVSKGQGANIQKISGLGSSGWIFIFPVIAMLVIFFLVPLVGVVYLSLTEWSLIGTPKYSGFTNYQEIFANPQFWSAVRVTGKLSLEMAIPGALIAFILAIMINEGKTMSQQFYCFLWYFRALLPYLSGKLCLKEMES